MKSHLLAAVISGCVVMTPFAGAQTHPSSDSGAEAAIVNPQRTVFDDSIGANVEVRKTVTGHLLVPARIDGKDAGWFILDTGAGMSCIDKQVADDLKLDAAGGITARGVGGERESTLRKFHSLGIGPVRVEDGVLLELNLKPYAVLMGDKIAGIIGHECFDAGVFDIDFANAKVAVFDPKTYELDPAVGAWTDMPVVKRRPAIAGSIEGCAPGLFVIDTGSNEALLIHAPAVKRLNLLDGRKTATSIAGGVGGMTKVRHGTLKSISIGACEVTDLPATFAEATDGVTSDDDALATAGLQLLEKFRMIVNQPGGKIALQRVAPAAAANPAMKPATKPSK